MKSIHPVSWVALAAAAAIASPALARYIPPKDAVVTVSRPSEPVEFEVWLPLRDKPGLDKLLLAQHTPGSPLYQKWITPQEFSARFGPTAQSVARVEAEMRAWGFTVTAVNARSIHVKGTVEQAQKAFSMKLETVTRPWGAVRHVPTSAPVMPAVLQQEGAVTYAFTRLPEHHVMSKNLGPKPANRTSAEGGYYFDDLKEAYDYPAVTNIVASGKNAGKPLDGAGVNAAVVMYGSIYTQDVANMFAEEKWTTYSTIPVPSVTTVLEDGAKAGKAGGTTEGSLDVQQIQGGAPGATVTYLQIPSLSDTYILYDYSTVVNGSNKYDVVNSSFGECELYYEPAYNDGHDYTSTLTTYAEVFQQGNSQGITYVASSGDEGGLECVPATTQPASAPFYQASQPGAYFASVSTPAIDPNVTAVGGGNLVTSYTAGNLASTYVGENGDGDPEVATNQDAYWGAGSTKIAITGGYWGATGGIGQIPSIDVLPAYQSLNAGVNVGATYRTNPDIGMQVGGCPGGESVTPCPQSGSEAGPYGQYRSYVEVFVNSKVSGSSYKGVDGLIGTSVSSPEFVGALALYIKSTGHRQGNINYYLYQAGAIQTMAGGISAPTAMQYYHRNIIGYDGVYTQASPTSAENYTYIYGNGSPDVSKLFGFSALTPTGTPQSTTNP